MGLGFVLPSSTPDEPGTMPGAARIYRRRRPRRGHPAARSLPGAGLSRAQGRLAADHEPNVPTTAPTTTPTSTHPHGTPRPDAGGVVLEVRLITEVTRSAHHLERHRGDQSACGPGLDRPRSGAEAGRDVDREHEVVVGADVDRADRLLRRAHANHDLQILLRRPQHRPRPARVVAGRAEPGPHQGHPGARWHRRRREGQSGADARRLGGVDPGAGDEQDDHRHRRDRHATEHPRDPHPPSDDGTPPPVPGGSLGHAPAWPDEPRGRVVARSGTLQRAQTSHGVRGDGPWASKTARGTGRSRSLSRLRSARALSPGRRPRSR